MVVNLRPDGTILCVVSEWRQYSRKIFNGKTFVISKNPLKLRKFSPRIISHIRYTLSSNRIVNFICSVFVVFTASLSWNNTTIVSGSRDRSILQWDHRTASHGNRYMRKLVGHSQEVCGLRWSPDHQLLASGGNDNKVIAV